MTYSEGQYFAQLKIAPTMHGSTSRMLLGANSLYEDVPIKIGSFETSLLAAHAFAGVVINNDLQPAPGTSDARCPRYLRGKDTMVLTDGSLDLQVPVRDGSGRAVCTSFPSLSAVVTSFPSQEDQDFDVPDQDSVVAGVTATLPNLPVGGAHRVGRADRAGRRARASRSRSTSPASRSRSRSPPRERQGLVHERLL